MRFLKTAFISLIAAMSITSMQSNAALMHQDYKTTGDAKITYHQETNLSWLKLNNTVSMSLNQVKAQLGDGGLFSGWRLPTDDEVESLVEAILSPLALNEDYTYYTGSGYRGYTATWRTWLGTTLYTSSGESSNGNKYWYSYGFYEGSSGNVEASGTYYRDKNSFGSHTYYASIYDDNINAYTADTISNQFGVFLVKIRPEDIPSSGDGNLEDGGAANPVPVSNMAILALFGLLMRKRLR